MASEREYLTTIRNAKESHEKIQQRKLQTRFYVSLQILEKHFHLQYF